MDKDFDTAGLQSFDLDFRCLIGGKYYDTRSAKIEKL